MGGGALSTALVAGAQTTAAHACHEGDGPPPDRYSDPVTVGLMAGISFGPKIRFIYGADLRFGRGPAAGFTRIEFRGVSGARLVGGVQLMVDEMSFEFGVAGHSGQRGTDLGRSLGIHGALGPGPR